MSSNKLMERVSAVFALMSIALLVSGTKACQEDYDLGSFSSTSGTPTATPEGGTSPAGSPTPTATATPTETPTEGETPDPTPTSDPLTLSDQTSSDQPSDTNGLLQELSKAGDESADEKVAAVAGNGATDGNWLGKNFRKDRESGEGKASDGAWLDSDGDGFADDFENASGSDPVNPLEFPETSSSWSSYKNRVRAQDSDLDGVANSDEARLGTNPQLMDSDGDTRPDGAEVLSGGDPKRSDDRYKDTDGDGLSDAYENEQGLNTSQLDSDSDGLRDDLELVVGSNPLKVDTDGDGISDGKEFDIETDPTVPDGAEQ